MSRSASTSRPVVPERFGWSLTIVLMAAILYSIICLGGLVVGVVQLVNWVQPGARIPVTLPMSYVLPTNGMHNSYSGSPYVPDGTAVTATEVSTTLSAVPLPDRIGLACVPIVWALTALAVTVCISVAVRGLRLGAAFGAGTSRPMVAAALSLAVGSTVAQILDGIATLGVHRFGWAAPHIGDMSLTSPAGFTFEFAPLAFSAALLVIALVLRRGFALQRETDGLI